MGHTFKRITNCRACGSTDLMAYLDLPSSPPANGLLLPEEKNPERIEIMVMVCKSCFLSQLSVVVDPETMYRNYAYHSSISKTFRNHCRDLAKSLRASFVFKNDPPRLLDIASNDGCLMREFKTEGFDVAGVEPCGSMVKKCKEENLFSIHRFFDSELSKVWVRKADVVTATNVFAHVDDIQDFLRGVKSFLEPEKGVFVVEVPHMLSLLDHNQFDTIYHEHLSYFLLRPLIGLFQINGLEIFGVDRIEIHGGSIRVYAGFPGAHPIENSVQDCISDEESGGMFDLNTYKDFANWIVRLGADLRTVMDFTRINEKKVMGYGASAKGISLTNYLGIGKYIHSIVDETPAKQGKLTPGEGIPICGFEAFEKEKPDYIVLFAWNFAEEMIAKTKHLGARYIVPIPEPKIL